MNQVYPILKLAAALFAYLHIEPKLNELTKDWGTWAPMAANTAALIASAALVHFVSGRVIARPRLNVEWLKDRYEAAGPCEQLHYDSARPAIQVYTLQVRLKKESWFARLVARIMKSAGCHATVSFDKPDVVLVEELPAQSHSAASVVNGSARYELRNATTGLVSWMDVSLEAVGSMPRTLDITCEYSSKVGSCPGWLSRLLLPVSSQVRTFQIGS